MNPTNPTAAGKQEYRRRIEEDVEYREQNKMDAATYHYGEDEEIPQRLVISPIFGAIWDEVKTWDINVPYAYHGYMGATGTHVHAILKALSDAGVIDLEQIKTNAVSDPRNRMLKAEASHD